MAPSKRPAKKTATKRATHRRKHHQPHTIDQKLDALLYAAALGLHRERQNLREGRKSTAHIEGVLANVTNMLKASGHDTSALEQSEPTYQRITFQHPEHSPEEGNPSVPGE